MKSRIESVYIFNEPEERICQGDIYRDLEYNYRIYKDENGKLATDRITLPYVIVLSQDCDLESDYRNRTQKAEEQKTQDKFLHSLLVCTAYPAEELRHGTHLSGPGFHLTMENYNTKRWDIIEDNKNERYHCLTADLNLQIPNLAIDFKHYFTVPRSELYGSRKKHYVASINELHREALSQRFANYVSRIGLPGMKIAENPVKAK